MGLLFSPLIIGLQNTVEWGRRGTLTGSLMYSRYLGQSIGAAGFGAIANTVLRQHQDSTQAVAIHASTHAVFVGVLLVALLAIVVLLAVPSRFPAYDADEDQGEEVLQEQPAVRTRAR